MTGGGRYVSACHLMKVMKCLLEEDTIKTSCKSEFNMQGSKDQTLMMQSAAPQLLCSCLFVDTGNRCSFWKVFQNVKIWGAINISLAF